MPRHRANLLEPDDIRRLLRHTETTRHPQRNAVIVLLSFKAGLRACEIAGLTWPMVLKPNLRLADHISVSSTIAKYGSGRRLPLNPELRRSLKCHHRNSGRPCDGPVIASERGGHMTPRSIVNWFGEVYSHLELHGCSSHSGRRTFITRSARLLGQIGGSLRDVQELAGHRALTTTERYIEGDRASQRALVGLI